MLAVVVMNKKCIAVLIFSDGCGNEDGSGGGEFTRKNQKAKSLCETSRVALSATACTSAAHSPVPP